jgi:3-hydroxyisobutyrate dehydrogenase-like beta-hydroxyacid dehydrogenase
MGAEVGRALLDAGHDVGWLPAGRGAGTRRRALAADLRELSDIAGCEVVLSICPPAVAMETARSAAGFTGLYVDANAISPTTASDVAAVVRSWEGHYVDGGIVGPPPQCHGRTRLYLSGRRAEEVAELFLATRVEPVVLPGSDTAASALKMMYAAWTKISAALLVSIQAAASDLAVVEALAREWARSQPELQQRYADALAGAKGKGWRWEDEMREIARTFSAVGEPSGFGEAAAELFARWPRPPDD